MLNVDSALATLANNPSAPVDVTELALGLARDEYPTLDPEAELSEIVCMARELRPRLRGPLSGQVQALQRYLFHEQGFTGNSSDYHDPRNSYLNEVLARRTGLPITLAIITAAVATRAGLQVVGVGLPGHFIVKATQRNDSIYFDPFNSGRVLSMADCAARLTMALGPDAELTVETLAEAPPGYIITRMLRNLESVYLHRRDYLRLARVIARLRQLAPEDASRRRDLGVALLQAGRPGQAINHLAAYLDTEPPPVDRVAIRELLDQAQGEVARWN